jgi:hypothetical protein
MDSLQMALYLALLDYTESHKLGEYERQYIVYLLGILRA